MAVVKSPVHPAIASLSPWPSAVWRECSRVDEKLITTTWVRNPGGAPDVGYIGDIHGLEVTQLEGLITQPEASLVVEHAGSRLYGLTERECLFLWVAEGADELVQWMVPLMELAENVLACRRICLCLEHDQEQLEWAVHALLYVGFKPISTNARFLLLELAL